MLLFYLSAIALTLLLSAFHIQMGKAEGKKDYIFKPCYEHMPFTLFILVGAFGSIPSIIALSSTSEVFLPSGLLFQLLYVVGIFATGIIGIIEKPYVLSKEEFAIMYFWTTLVLMVPVFIGTVIIAARIF